MRRYRLLLRGNTEIEVAASNRREALAKLFLDVLNGQIPLNSLGQVIYVWDGSEMVPFRTVPALYLLGVLDWGSAVYNLQRLLSVSREEAEKLLRSAAEKDGWIKEEIRRVSESERGS